MTKYFGREEHLVEIYVTVNGHVAIKSTGLEDNRDVTLLITPRQAELIAKDLPSFALIAEQNFMELTDE